jgi:very-short-patch-repair endonuclease
MRRAGSRQVQSAKDLRKAAPVPERLLWSRIRNGQCGAKFRRQHPLAGAIADFACLEHRLIIELDGQSHSFSGPRDEARQAQLEADGWTLIRIPNDDLLKDLDGWVQVISYWIAGKEPSA